MTMPSPSEGGFSLRSVLPMLFFDGLCPYLSYVLLKHWVPGISEVAALGIGAIFPAAYGIFEIVKKGQVDIMGTVVLIGHRRQHRRHIRGRRSEDAVDTRIVCDRRAWRRVPVVAAVAAAPDVLRRAAVHRAYA